MLNHRYAMVVAILLAGISMQASVSASGLSLGQAEQMALANDPGINAIEASQLALDEMAVAARQLPDPMLKMGLMSVPTDTFSLSQQGTTQPQIGLVQEFPRGHSRSLQSEQISFRSDGLDERVRDQKLQIILAVREMFLEVEKQQHRAIINSAATVTFSDLLDITQDYYATGRVYQQDVLQASVELAKVEDRATRIQQAEEQARAKLATWIGDAAFGAISVGWPPLDNLQSVDAIEANLKNHPRVQMAQKNVQVADTGVELARQNYKPQFSVDLTYGARSGRNPDGSSQADQVSLMVVMDVPLFAKNRQDRVLAAQIAELSSSEFSLDDVHRRMRSELEFYSAMYQRQKERLALYENKLLPEAGYSAEASLEAYQSSLTDLTTLLRAQVTEFDLRLEYAGLQADALISQARLLYLQGEQQ